MNQTDILIADAGYAGNAIAPELADVIRQGLVRQTDRTLPVPMDNRPRTVCGPTSASRTPAIPNNDCTLTAPYKAVHLAGNTGIVPLYVAQQVDDGGNAPPNSEPLIMPKVIPPAELGLLPTRSLASAAVGRIRPNRP